ncbi:MAG: adenosylmethionine decarboxylase [Spirochaetia bacterium]|nr:adenosylmethionine decarboxylase [Spirochaetia bacterium]
MAGKGLGTQNLIDRVQMEHTQKLDKGIHILADMYEVKGGRTEMVDAKALEEFCEEKVADVGLTQVGKLFYQFPGSGVTGVILLAESHVAIHTWPEKDYLTLDIYVCNVTQNNTTKARKLMEYFSDLFTPGDMIHQEIERE